ncbi:MAG: hypothetical protein JWL90_4361 [Chthoniobacteraceae bacterium]|nr:hypothetical protein [Chthoniobacteraceae bacterium]
MTACGDVVSFHSGGERGETAGTGKEWGIKSGPVHCQAAQAGRIRRHTGERPSNYASQDARF